jgi:hypothetical protein
VCGIHRASTRAAGTKHPKLQEVPADPTQPRLNARSALLGLFVALTIVLASTTVYESGIRTTLTSTSTLTQTTTVTSSTTSTETTTSIRTQTTALTTTSTSYSTSYALLPAACASADSSYFAGTGAGTVVVGASSPAIVCLQLYDFNLTSPIVLNTTSLLSIPLRLPPAKAGGGNFTIATSQDELTMGGPSDLNEGTIVAYSITANPGASGTYFLWANGFNVSGDSYGDGPQVPCPIGVVIAGTGTPSYLTTTEGCGYAGGSPIEPFSIPGFNYTQLQSNQLYFKIVDSLNSTQ